MNTAHSPWSTPNGKGTAVMVYACGGTGRRFASLVLPHLAGPRALSVHYIETRVPEGVPVGDCIELHPERLPRDPTGSAGEWARLTGISDAQYREYVKLVSPDGLSQLPCMGWIAAGIELPTMRARIQRDMEAINARHRKISSVTFLTIASAAGGTGAPSARVAGLAARLEASGPKFPDTTRWLHILVTSSVLSGEARTRRTLALEHQQLLELQQLIRPGAALNVPGVPEPVRTPGPDHVVLIGSSPEAHRTIEETAEEFAAVLANWLD